MTKDEAPGTGEWKCPKCGAQVDERFDCCEVHEQTRRAPVGSWVTDAMTNAALLHWFKGPRHADLREFKGKDREDMREAIGAAMAAGEPANSAQVTDALKSAEKALRPYYNAVFNDNGDIEVDGPYDYDEAVAGYFAYKKIERAIAAIGAGEQAVACPRCEGTGSMQSELRGFEHCTTCDGAGKVPTLSQPADERVALPPITDRGLAGQIIDAAWPEFGGDLQTAEFWNDFGTGVEFALKTLSQPHPADERVAETTPQAIRDQEIQWAVGRWRAEVENRPLRNVHRRSLDDSWRQVIRHFGGDPEALCGPAHDELLEFSAKEGRTDG